MDHRIAVLERVRALHGALRGRRIRLLLTGTGVAAAAVLVLVLVASYRSLARGVVAYVGQPAIDLWVAPAGTDNLIRSSALIEREHVARIRDVPGVEQAHSVLRGFVTVEPVHPRRPGPAPRLTLLAVGYRAPAGLAGPPIMAAGHAPEIGRQIALDRAAAFRLGVGLNDTVQAGPLRLRVVGLTRGTNLIVTQFLFLPLGTAHRAQHLSGSASFVAVHVAAGADPLTVARAIEAQDTTLAVFSREEFVANNLREATAGIVPVLALLATLGVAVAAVLVVLLIQGLVEERRGEIAVCFALGSGVPHVGEALMARALILVMGGAAGGTALAYLLQQVLDRVLPTVELVFGVWDHAAVFGIFSLAGILAAGIPVLRLGRVDPLEAFRP
jgi:hypothetical protein